MEIKSKTIMENVLLFDLIRKDGKINARFSQSASQFEVYGFLKIYIKHLEEYLFTEFEENNEDQLY